MDRVLYRFLGNNPIQPNNFWIKTIRKINVVQYIQYDAKNSPWNKATSSKYSKRLCSRYCSRLWTSENDLVSPRLPSNILRAYWENELVPDCAPTLIKSRFFPPIHRIHTCSHKRRKFYIIPPRQFRLREEKHPIHTRGVSMKTEYQRPQLADSLL